MLADRNRRIANTLITKAQRSNHAVDKVCISLARHCLQKLSARRRPCFGEAFHQRPNRRASPPVGFLT